MGTNIAHRATVAHAGPSVLREPLRDSCTRRPVSLYLWVNRTWWTAPNLTAPMAAAEPGWPTPTTTWSATGYSRRAPTRTPQWWGSISYWNALPTETVYYSSLPLAKCSSFLSAGYPAVLLWQQTRSCSYQRLQVHSQGRWAGSGRCCGYCRSDHSSHRCGSCQLHVLQLR